MTDEQFLELKERSRKIFEKNLLIHCPYFQQEISLNSDGFHHLQFSDRRERNKEEQILKFNLLPLAIKVIKKSGTIQEFRKGLYPIGKKSKRDGSVILKNIEYWGFVAIIGNEPIRIRIILRRVGDGKIIFWSVMPAMQLSRDKLAMMRSLAKKGIEED